MKKLLAPAALVVVFVTLVLALSLAGLPWASPPAVLGQAAPAQGAATQHAYELVAPLGSVMTVMEDVFNKFPDRVKAGAPKDYKALRREAMFLAEMANLYGRLKDRASKKDWVEWCTLMKTSGMAMAEAAAKSDADGFKKAYETAKDSCSKCHEKYRD